MKIGIITFQSAHNYGAVLQAWALQEYLKQQGHEVEIVNLRLPVIDKVYRLTYKTKTEICGNKFVNRLVNEAYYQLRATYSCHKNPGKREKYQKFERFINYELPVTKAFYSYQELVNADLHYDAMIAGSDQIWNASMMKGINPAYFLQFGNKDALRISYAASIGTDEIPEKYRLLFDRFLRDFDAISIREQKAQTQIMEHTDKKVEIVADPTFLLKKEDFDKIRKVPNIKGKYIYVHNVHLKRVDEALNGIAEELSKRLGLPIIHNWASKIFSNEAGHFTGGAEEFLGMVSEAAYVVTNSFHCTVFAIIYQRNFVTVPHYKNPDRMRHLLSELGISDHLISMKKMLPDDLSSLQIDYAMVEQKKKKMGDQSREFLNSALQMKKEEDNRTYFETKDAFRCYGCGTCKEICPAEAIHMETDKEGFLYPVIDEERCTHCDKCRNVCIYHQKRSVNVQAEEMPAVYAAYHKDGNVVEKSTHGGIFTAIYRNILKKGGKVAGVRYDDGLQVSYDIAENEAECERFRGAKYVAADVGNTKERVKSLLANDQTVLFTGTSCQIAGLKSYLGVDYPKLYTIEIGCYGASSPKVFQKYCDYMEEKYQSKIVNFDFGNKFKDAAQPFIVTEFESGSADVEKFSRNNLGNAILNGNIQRPSCYTCEFVGVKAGVGDFSIEAFGEAQRIYPEFSNPKGVSILKINTKKGLALFQEFKEELILQKLDLKDVCTENDAYPMLMKNSRARLMTAVDNVPIDDLLLTFNRCKRGGIKGL